MQIVCVACPSVNGTWLPEAGAVMRRRGWKECENPELEEDQGETVSSGPQGHCTYSSCGYMHKIKPLNIPTRGVHKLTPR